MVWPTLGSRTAKEQNGTVLNAWLVAAAPRVHGSNLLDEARDERRAFPDDPCRLVLLLLGARHRQTVVHVTFQH